MHAIKMGVIKMKERIFLKQHTLTLLETEKSKCVILILRFLFNYKILDMLTNFFTFM